MHASPKGGAASLIILIITKCISEFNSKIFPLHCMFSSLKKYSAITLLCLLAFPAIIKTSHDFFHRDDFHCTSKDSHIHLKEHHCGVCDFYYSIASPTELSSFAPKLSFVRTPEPVFYAKILFLSAIPHHSLRGPPVIS